MSHEIIQMSNAIQRWNDIDFYLKETSKLCNSFNENSLFLIKVSCEINVDMKCRIQFFMTNSGLIYIIGL